MTSTVEDYLKQLVTFETEHNLDLISMKNISAALAVTPGTATSMIQRLDEKGLVEYLQHKGCRLTEAGRRVGLGTLRRHRLVELFLVRTLGMDWSTVHREAEMIEHSLSPEVEERLDRFLGYPKQGPHGGIIPDATGNLPPAEESYSLAEAAAGTRLIFLSVGDRDEALLRFLSEGGLYPGDTLIVDSITPGSGIVTLHPEKSGVHENVHLSLEQARMIRVAPAARHYDNPSCFRTKNLF